MSMIRCMTLAPSIVLVLGSFGCSTNSINQGFLIEPDGFVFMEADHGWGHIATLRIVDWGDKWIFVSVTDGQGRGKIGNMGRSQYQRLLSDLKLLNAFELESFTRDNVNDADLYRIDIHDGQQRNRIRIYCPWENAAESDSPATFAAGSSAGSKPHSDLVKRLLEEVERDDLRWDVCTYLFQADRQFVNTKGTEVADVFFTSDGELMYATTEYPKWAGGTADEPDGCVVWHSADEKQEPQRIPFNVMDDGPGPKFPRPESSINASYPVLPKSENFEAQHLAQPRVLCDGRIGVCVKIQQGTQLIAYLLDRPSAYQPILRLDNLSVHRKQIDVSPDGSRAAWINEGRLFVTEHVAVDCGRLSQRLESSIAG
jgi:hypothetical protein